MSITKNQRAGIRLGQVARRQNKPSYKHLSSAEYHYCKLLEHRYQYLRVIWREDARPDNHGWRQRPEFAEIMNAWGGLELKWLDYKLPEKYKEDRDLYDNWLMHSTSTGQYGGSHEGAPEAHKWPRF